jgi:hypothetical protein
MNLTVASTLMSIFVVSAVAQAECKLERPIPFSGSMLDERYLADVTVDATPKFLRPENYDPARGDTLEVDLFQTEYEQVLTGWVGGRIHVTGKREWVGFTNWYRGPTSIEGSITERDGKTTYLQRITFDWANPRHALAVFEQKVVTRGNEILAVELTYPIQVIDHVDGPYTYVNFTGENHTLCVKSAR